MWSIARCGRQLGEGRHAQRRRLQARALVQLLHLRPIRIAIEVAHQDRVRMVVQQFGDEGSLRGARAAPSESAPPPPRGRRAVAELREQHAAPAHAAGQGMVVDFHGSSFDSKPFALEATPPTLRLGWWLQYASPPRCAR
jgi:hypothetical protein